MSPARSIVKCQAQIDDYDRPAYRASMQRITVPGTKNCTRNAKVKLGDLCFCDLHARLAREGFVESTGRVSSKNSIADVRRSNDRRPKGTPRWRLEHWADDKKPEPI